MLCDFASSYANIFMSDSKKKNLLSNLEQICNIPTLHRQHFYGMEKIRKCTKTIYDRKKSETLVNQI